MRLCFLICGLTFIASLSYAQTPAIDSSQWPFPDTIWMQVTVGGQISEDFGRELQNGQSEFGSSTYQGSVSTVPVWYTWHNVDRVDSNVWHLSFPGYVHAYMTLITDTVHRKILSLDYREDYMYSKIRFTVNDLDYSDSSITISDNALSRHLCSFSYEESVIQSTYSDHKVFCCLNSGSIFHNPLRRGIQYPTSIDFRNSISNINHDTTITFVNSTNIPVKILGYSLNDPDSAFSLFDTAQLVLQQYDTARITVRFRSEPRKISSAILSVRTDEVCNNIYGIALSGASPFTALVVSQYPSEFVVDSGTTSKQKIVIRNNGTISAVIDSFLISGSQSFAVDSPAAPLTIRPNDSTRLVVSFRPTSVAKVQSTLTVTSQDNSTASIQLYGNGLRVSKNSVGIESEEENLTISGMDQICFKPYSQDRLIRVYSIIGRLVCCAVLQSGASGFSHPVLPSGTYIATDGFGVHKYVVLN